jgi:hypothetical protein
LECLFVISLLIVFLFYFIYLFILFVYLLFSFFLLLLRLFLLRMTFHCVVYLFVYLCAYLPSCCILLLSILFIGLISIVSLYCIIALVISRWLVGEDVDYEGSEAEGEEEGDEENSEDGDTDTLVLPLFPHLTVCFLLLLYFIRAWAHSMIRCVTFFIVYFFHFSSLLETLHSCIRLR